MSDETATPPQIKIGTLAGVVVAFLLFVAIAGYSARMTRDYTDYDQTRATARYDTLAKIREAENKLLYPVDDQKKPTAEWVDQDKGIIHISIDEAMVNVVQQYKDEKPGPGCEINPPAAAPAKAPAAPGAPAANPAPAAPAANPAPAAGKPAPPGAAPSAPAAKPPAPSPAKNPANGTAQPAAAAGKAPAQT